MDDTEHLLALVHAVGFRAGASTEGTRFDCPFCDDRMDLCSAWLVGFSTGRLARRRAEPSSGDVHDLNRNSAS